MSIYDSQGEVKNYVSVFLQKIDYATKQITMR